MRMSPYKIHAIFANKPLCKIKASTFPAIIRIIPMKTCYLNVILVILFICINRLSNSDFECHPALFPGSVLLPTNRLNAGLA